MSREDVATLALKLLGVYFLAGAIPFLGHFVTTLRSEHVLVLLVPFLLTVVVGVLLICAARRLGRVLTGDTGAPGVAGSLSVSDWQSIAFSAIGVSLFVHGLPQLGSLARFDPGRSIWPYVVAPAIQIVVGIVLFLRAKGLANVWRRLQESGPIREGTN